MNKKQRRWRNRIIVALVLFVLIFAAEHLLPLLLEPTVAQAPWRFSSWEAVETN